MLQSIQIGEQDQLIFLTLQIAVAMIEADDKSILKFRFMAYNLKTWPILFLIEL